MLYENLGDLMSQQIIQQQIQGEAALSPEMQPGHIEAGTSALTATVNRMREAGRGAVSSLVERVSSLGNKLKDETSADISDVAKTAVSVAGTVGVAASFSGSPAEAASSSKPPKPQQQPMFIDSGTSENVTKIVNDRVMGGQGAPASFVLTASGLEARQSNGEPMAIASANIQQALDEAGKIVGKSTTPYLPTMTKPVSITNENGSKTMQFACPSPEKAANYPTISNIDIKDGLTAANFCPNDKVDFTMSKIPNTQKFQAGLKKFSNDPLTKPFGGDFAKETIYTSCGDLSGYVDPFSQVSKTQSGGIKVKFQTQTPKYCHEVGTSTVKVSPYVRIPGKGIKKAGKPNVRVFGATEAVTSTYLNDLVNNTVSTNGVKVGFCKGKNQDRVAFGFKQEYSFKANPGQTYTHSGNYKSGKVTMWPATKKLC